MGYDGSLLLTMILFLCLCITTKIYTRGATGRQSRNRDPRRKDEEEAVNEYEEEQLLEQPDQVPHPVDADVVVAGDGSAIVPDAVSAASMSSSAAGAAVKMEEVDEEEEDDEDVEMLDVSEDAVAALEPLDTRAQQLKVVGDAFRRILDAEDEIVADVGISAVAAAAATAANASGGSRVLTIELDPARNLSAVKLGWSVILARLAYQNSALFDSSTDDTDMNADDVVNTEALKYELLEFVLKDFSSR